jgi:peroxiredoxin
MPHLDSVHQRYQNNGLIVLGISVDDSDPADVRRFIQRLGVTFPIAMADEKVLDEYGPIRSIPTTFFISRDGHIVRRVVGYLDQETIETYVRELF